MVWTHFEICGVGDRLSLCIDKTQLEIESTAESLYYNAPTYMAVFIFGSISLPFGGSINRLLYARFPELNVRGKERLEVARITSG